MVVKAIERNSTTDKVRFAYRSWSDIAGNRAAKRFLQKLLKKLRKEIKQGNVSEESRLCLLIVGDSRTGKTSMITFFHRCLFCEELDEVTLTPCDGSCSCCRSKIYKDGQEGVFAAMARKGTRLEVELTIHDCTKINGPGDVSRMFQGFEAFHRGLSIHYFDEAHRLVERKVDERLLTAMERYPFLWIFSTAHPDKFEPMFLNRLIKLRTQKPTMVELVEWLKTRCQEWGIKYEDKAVVRVAEKSNLITGTALHALALASLDKEVGLTEELVEFEWNPGINDD